MRVSKISLLALRMGRSRNVAGTSSYGASRECECGSAETVFNRRVGHSGSVSQLALYDDQWFATVQHMYQ